VLRASAKAFPLAQDKDAESCKSAEIAFPGILGGIFDVEAKLSNVKGTCQGFFTYAMNAESNGWHDEMVLVKSSSLFETFLTSTLLFDRILRFSASP
jgi:hypothetical protein